MHSWANTLGYSFPTLQQLRLGLVSESEQELAVIPDILFPGNLQEKHGHKQPQEAEPGIYLHITTRKKSYVELLLLYGLSGNRPEIKTALIVPSMLRNMKKLFELSGNKAHGNNGLLLKSPFYKNNNTPFSNPANVHDSLITKSTLQHRINLLADHRCFFSPAYIWKDLLRSKHMQEEASRLGMSLSQMTDRRKGWEWSQGKNCKEK